MRKNVEIIAFVLTFVAIGGMSIPAAGETTTATSATTTTETTTTTTIITETVLQGKKEWAPFKVCVLDFTSLDILGQKRFLDNQNQEINVPPQCTLSDEDRESVNGIMQGFVRMIDAWDNTRTNAANRSVQEENNAFNRARALELYNNIVKGEARPMVIGAEYLSAYLGRHNDVFSCVDASQMVAAMQKLQQAPDFPNNFMLNLARETGATHLIYGTVSDMRTKTNSFKGYGIETQTISYQLDVIIKLVDLAAQRTVYSNVYTGSCREQRPVSGGQFDNNIFQNLMTSALEQAAEDLYDNCRPGRKNKITVTPLPFTLTVTPSGGMFFKPADAEIFIDGIRVGNGGSSFLIPAGKHAVEIQAPGYQNKRFDINLTKDETINTKLEK